MGENDILEKSLKTCEDCRSAGYSCAESVLRGLSTAFGLHFSDQFYRGMSAFAGGAAADGRCGTLEAGLAVLTIIYEKGLMKDDYKLEEYAKMMNEHFVKQHGSFLCSDIFYPIYEEYISTHSNEDDFRCAFFSGIEADLSFLSCYLKETNYDLSIES